MAATAGPVVIRMSLLLSSVDENSLGWADQSPVSVM